MTVNVLAGDIGGTKTILAVFSPERGPRDPLVRRTYPSPRYPTFEAIVEEFIDEVGMECGAACFGVAGPVVDDRARITNLPWVVDGPALQSAFGWPAVALLNDMTSLGWAVPVLGEKMSTR